MKTKDAFEAVQAAIRELEGVIQFLEEIGEPGDMLLGSKVNPDSSASARFFACDVDGGTSFGEGDSEIPTRLRIVLDAGDLVELAKWAHEQAVHVGQSRESGTVCLELNGVLIFEMDEEPTINTLRKTVLEDMRKIDGQSDG